MVGRKLALVIGNNYPDSDKELKFAVADAKKIKEVLANKDICGFDVDLLINGTSGEASTKLEALITDTHQDDIIFIYFSGHGKKDPNNKLHLLFKNSNEKLLNSSAVSFDFINECLRSPSALKASIIIVLDCCYSGLAGIRGEDLDVTEALEKPSGPGTIILTSTGWTGSPTAKEEEKLGHGVFTYYLIEGLEKGHADQNGDGYVSVDEFYEYAYRKTKENSSQLPAKKGSIEGNIYIGKTPKITKEKQHGLNKKKLHKEFGNQHQNYLGKFLKNLDIRLGKPSHILGLVMILVLTISMASNIIGDSASNRTASEPTHPVANLSVTPTSGNAPLTVTFTDQSTGNIFYKWWGFGDGTGSGSSVNTINHTYFNAGKYKVFLKVSSPAGNDTSKYKYITVNESAYKFDLNNGNDGKSPWGIPLSSLPPYETYHLPAKEGYIAVQNQYDFIDETTNNYSDSDPTDGNGFYFSTLSPDIGHWSWDGSYTPDEDSTKELIPGSQDHIGVVSKNGKNMPSGKGAKVRIYSPYTRMTVIAVVGDNGPAPWTGCQFGASNKVFKALGLPDSYNGFSKENPNPGYGSNMSDSIIKYADNPYWVEVSWADQSLPVGPLTSSSKKR